MQVNRFKMQVFRFNNQRFDPGGPFFCALKKASVVPGQLLGSCERIRWGPMLWGFCKRIRSILSGIRQLAVLRPLRAVEQWCRDVASALGQSLWGKANQRCAGALGREGANVVGVLQAHRVKLVGVLQISGLQAH